MGLDFRTATDLFLGREEELARALRVDLRMLRQHRRDPGRVPDVLVTSLADVLAERGRAMVRVAEMLREDATGADGNGVGGRTGGR